MANHINQPYFCIHSSYGFFYNQEYLEKWCEIAERRHNVIFYTYIHRSGADFSIVPSNFKVIRILEEEWPIYWDNTVSYNSGEICPKFINRYSQCLRCMKCLDTKMKIPHRR